MENLVVVPYEPALQPAFKALNVAWIEHDFGLEASDLEQLDDPETTLLAGGGQVFFLLDNGQPVGTCGLALEAAGTYHMVKMAISAEKQGRGYSRVLAEAALLWAWQQGGRLVTLETNARQQAAIGLYKRLGFVNTPPHASSYRRADVFMALDLAQWATAHGSDG